jgi:CobQ-like glutamine amidotransferase family enzyme
VTARILQLFPELTDVNGDAQNALVLARRAQWAGEDARVETLPLGERPGAERPAAVVLGSSVDSALPRLRDALRDLREVLVEWLDGGVPLLAVGTGLELLGSEIRLGEDLLDGIGLLPLTTEPLAVRVADDLVVDAPEGRLVGYENHSRGVRLDPGVEPLGVVVRGVADGRGVDGVRHRGVVGTRLHGPVLAKNPALADALLTRAFGRPIRPDSDTARAADAAAAAIRDRLLKSIAPR